MADSSVVIPFEGGLDMVTPAQTSAPGTLVDCMNYEVGPIKGYRRIDGYERYDGGVDGGLASVYVMKARPSSTNPALAIVPGTFILRFPQTLGRVVAVGPNNTVYFVAELPGLRIDAGDTSMRVSPPGGGGSSMLIVEEGMRDAREVGLGHAEYMAIIYAAQAFFRNGVQEAPNKIAGIYAGRHRTYAVVDALTLVIPVHEMPEDGSYVRIEGKAYRLLWGEAGIGWFAKLPYPDTADTGLRLITYGQLVGGSGSYATISSYQVATTLSDGTYGQVYIVEDGYTPLHPAPYVMFEDATAAPEGTVRLVTTSGYSLHEVLSYSVDAGSFGTGDARGRLYLKAGTASSTFTGVYPYASAIDLTNSDGTVVYTENAFAYMPLIAGTRALRSERTPSVDRRYYQWGTYNFKATRGNEFVYFVSGSSRGGWVEDTQLATDISWGNIVTGIPFADEIPKYLSYHAGQRLLLAYANGSIVLSAVGDPLNFSGLEGAVEIGNGDNITGVLEASDDSTLIFGPRSIRRLAGLGTGLSLRTISSETGAMDYSACVVAGVPIYINHNGMCTLDQTSAYGDFKNSSISGAIDPFFTPRIVQEMGSIEDGGVMCAFPVRAKNQYRVFLQDGNVVSMSLTTAGPQPTKGTYETELGGTRLPIAYSSGVDDDGHENILCVWDDVVPDAKLDPPNMKMAYRLDHGWGFDGKTFEHYIDTAYMFNQDPQFLSIDKAVLYGMGYGDSTLRLRASGVEDDFDQSFETTVQDISMPRNPQAHYRVMGKVMGEIDHANWGRAVKLRFSGLKEPGSSETEPPHILQSVRLFVQTDGISEN